MINDESHELLRRYHRDGSETDFRLLVERHGPAVFATACRRLGGDRAAAQDVTQEVFHLLARKAGQLNGVVLAGWLFRQTCRRAANHARAESRRRRREQFAVVGAGAEAEPARDSEIRESLDEALLSLPSKDRDVLVLRFFEGRDYRGIGAVLGTAEEAARKRVARALVKLETALARRGVAVGSVAAGGSLREFHAAPMSDEWVAEISRAAVIDGSAGGGAVLCGGWKPLLLGLISASLVVPPVMAVRGRPMGTGERVAGSAILSRIPDRTARGEGSGESLESVIASIRLAHAGPDHRIGKLRMGAILEQLPIGRFAEFFELARDGLTPEQKAACYEPLLDRWRETDGLAALDFALDHRLGSEVNATKGTNLLLNLFSDLLRSDPSAAADWLLMNWNAEELGEGAFRGTLRDQLAGDLAYHSLLREGAEQAVGIALSLPSEEARIKALEALTGGSPYSSSWLNLDAGGLLALHRELAGLPDQALATRLIASLWRETSESVPEKAAAAEDLMTAAERYQLELGRLGIRSRPSARTELLTGGVMTSAEAVEPLANLDAAIQAGRDAGIPEAEVLAQVGATVLSVTDEETSLSWLDEHRGMLAMDEMLERKIGEIGVYDGILIGGEGPEQRVIRLADRLDDDERKVIISRAAFRRILARSAEEAATFLGSAEISDPLRAELRNLAMPSE